MTEAELIAAYKAARAEAHRMEKLLEEHFFDIVRETPKTVEGLEEVKRLAARCPESVTLVFLMDTIRQREVKLGIREWQPGYEKPKPP